MNIEKEFHKLSQPVGSNPFPKLGRYVRFFKFDSSRSSFTN